MAEDMNWLLFYKLVFVFPLNYIYRVIYKKKTLTS